MNVLVLTIVLTVAQPAAEKQSPAPPKLPPLKAELFETLVNPDCSHCKDEAERRKGDLRPDDRVLAWIRGKYDGGAIPLRFFLAKYRVISDTYGVFVYDADAGMVRGFEPSLDFSFAGRRNGVMTIKHKDGTVYSALSGRGIEGPNKDRRLKPVATLATSWGTWLARYPNGVAYNMFPKYQPLPLPKEVPLPAADRRLSADQTVLGIEIGGAARAYPFDPADSKIRLLQDVMGKERIAVLWYGPTRTAVAYAAATDGSPSRSLTLAVDSAKHDAPLVDKETSSHWDFAGRAVSGPLRGQTLRWLPGVQCRWWAWAAEFPRTEVHQSADRPNKKDQSRIHGQKRAERRVYLVRAEQVTPLKVAELRAAKATGLAVVLDETVSKSQWRELHAQISKAKLPLAAWIEVARNPALADHHPQWMASLGAHGDWRQRFPKLKAEPNKVAKVYPWVPIWYQPAYEWHLQRIAQLVQMVDGQFDELLVNDIQGAPSSCGCGNDQCRWAIDYQVPSTAEVLRDPQTPRRFVEAVERLIGGKPVVPVWCIECERDDQTGRMPGTGYCGSVPCFTGACWKEFGKQLSPLSDRRELAVLLLSGELRREDSTVYGGQSWLRQAIGAMSRPPGQTAVKEIPTQRLLAVLQGWDKSEPQRRQQITAVQAAGAGGFVMALTRINQSWTPKFIGSTSNNHPTAPR